VAPHFRFWTWGYKKGGGLTQFDSDGEDGEDDEGSEAGFDPSDDDDDFNQEIDGDLNMADENMVYL
jgi:hypothetical protein